jgi:hypothetical protein
MLGDLTTNDQSVSRAFGVDHRATRKLRRRNSFEWREKSLNALRRVLSQRAIASPVVSGSRSPFSGDRGDVRLVRDHPDVERRPTSCRPIDEQSTLPRRTVHSLRLTRSLSEREVACTA